MIRLFKCRFGTLPEFSNAIFRLELDDDRIFHLLDDNTGSIIASDSDPGVLYDTAIEALKTIGREQFDKDIAEKMTPPPQITFTEAPKPPLERIADALTRLVELMEAEDANNTTE